MPEPESRGRILVIDDQDATRYVFRRILTRAGYRVDEAGTGSDGLTQALSLPDLIISDVNLPDMLGYEVCRRLRANAITVNIPVLQISAAFVSNESMVQALEGGADSYMMQPVEPTVLLAQVSALLRMRRAEAMSNLSARQWQTTFDALSDGLALVNAGGEVTRVNRTFLELLGLNPSDVERRNIADVFESFFEMNFEQFQAAVAGGEPLELSALNRWFRVRYDPIEADPASSGGSVLLVAEITDYKKLQETLRLSERLAATGRLAHIIAHEINNPLEAMSNLLYLAQQDTPENTETSSHLKMASEELMRIGRITKQVLAYHRESKHPVLTKANELIEGVLAMFRAQMLLNNVELEVELRCETSLSVHPGEIRQVFSNLIANALDAMGEAGGHLRVRCNIVTDQVTHLRGVRFVFSDSGTGIPAHVYPKIFNAFYTTKETRGSGIGLWLSSEVIAKHRGSVHVRTRTEGKHRGTLFAVFLPLPRASNGSGLAPD